MSTRPVVSFDARSVIGETRNIPRLNNNAMNAPSRYNSMVDGNRDMDNRNTMPIDNWNTMSDNNTFIQPTRYMSRNASMRSSPSMSGNPTPYMPYTPSSITQAEKNKREAKKQRNIYREITVLTVSYILSGIVVAAVFAFARYAIESIRRRRNKIVKEEELYEPDKYPHVIKLSTAQQFASLVRPHEREATKDEIDNNQAIIPFPSDQPTFERDALTMNHVRSTTLRKPYVRYFIPNIIPMTISPSMKEMFTKKPVYDFKQNTLRMVQTGNYPYVIEIYAKWCPHCQDTQGEVDNFAKRHPHIPVFVVDVANLNPAQERVVTEFPTLLYYRPNSKTIQRINTLKDLQIE